ncbi:MAG: polysaccharide biosynthesis tyrosine autokinase [Burkholderiales bacterium]|nr:polysaccharide biosynthesis tyrosine autokinase [Burkholderiales bacterium]MDE2433731.1 polysaccharide biosynthesis tyrosine autokinase [Burkholderiales bacterium]
MINANRSSAAEDPATQDAFLGDILQKTNGLSVAQIQDTLAYQREHGMRFGEAAVALGFAKPDDVVWALAQQFRYPYAPKSLGTEQGELVVANDPFNEDVESFRDLRSQLAMGVFGEGQARQALAILSSDIGDGKTFVAANLAVAFSQLPGRTLVIDANLREPRMHEVFGVEQDAGLSGVLAGRSQPNVIKPIAHLPNLYLMPAGVLAPNPAELLQGPAFSLFLTELHSRFDYIVVDTPAASVGADARVIATHCGSALIVGRANRSRLMGMQSLVKLLNKSKVKMAGVLMNQF